MKLAGKRSKGKVFMGGVEHSGFVCVFARFFYN